MASEQFPKITLQPKPLPLGSLRSPCGKIYTFPVPLSPPHLYLVLQIHTRAIIHGKWFLSLSCKVWEGVVDQRLSLPTVLHSKYAKLRDGPGIFIHCSHFHNIDQISVSFPLGGYF